MIVLAGMFDNSVQLEQMFVRLFVDDTFFRCLSCFDCSSLMSCAMSIRLILVGFVDRGDGMVVGKIF